MKKLMMAAAIVCAAAYANAALVDWGVDYFADPDGGQAGNYGWLLIDSGMMQNGGAVYTIVAATQDLANGDVSFLSTYALKDGDGVQAAGMDNYGWSSLGDNGSGDDVIANDQKNIRAYLVITDSADLDKVTKALIVSGYEGDGDPVVDNIGKGGTAENGFQFGDISSYSSNPDNWQSVPEPTSGLLLLLGVAGLALRRRRA